MAVHFGGITANPGTRVRGSMGVGSFFDGTEMKVPFAIVNGARPGRTLWLIAGVHGDEIEGMVAAQKFVRDLDAQQLSGCVVAILCANPWALADYVRESPIDGRDLNRTFPGNPTGTFTERLAHQLLQSMLPLMTPDDVVLNIHGGGRTTVAARLIEVRATEDEVETKSLELARAACNPDLDIIVKIREGNPSAPGPWAALYKGTFLTELHATVQAARITIESGGLGRLDSRDVNAHYSAFCNVLRYMEMVRGEPIRPTGGISIIPANVRVTPCRRGFWFRETSVRARLREGAPIARVCDIYGDTIEDVVAPFDCIVLYLRERGVINPESGSHSDRFGANVGRLP